MQHKHVEVIRREWTYLRLSLPPSKGHSFPITTMPWAVKVYERIHRHRWPFNESGVSASWYLAGIHLNFFYILA